MKRNARGGLAITGLHAGATREVVTEAHLRTWTKAQQQSARARRARSARKLYGFLFKRTLAK